MSANRILILQSVGIFLQMVNAQIGVITHNASIAALAGAAIGAYQFYIQHLGNQSPAQGGPKP
jgi:hypothetical protein